jgi:hypothetical protein
MTLQEDIQRISCLFLLIKLCVRGWPPLVQQSVVTQCDADRSMGPALALCLSLPLPLAPGALQAFETSQPLPMQRPASMHPCMADSSSAWWRCLASDPGPGHWPLAPTFRPLAAGSESKQASPASHQEKSKSAEADFNAPKHRDIAHGPSPSLLQRRGWQDRGDPGDIVCRSVNSCRL